MTKIFVKLYEDFEVTGRDFSNVKSDLIRRLVFSPDGSHSISVVPLKDGTLLFTNEKQCEFSFSISRNHRVLAVVRYQQNAASLTLNNNWLLNQEIVQNRTINTNPDLIFSENLNIDFEGTALARVDLKINTSPIAAAFFTERDLIFIRMNGNHTLPRLKEHIQNEAAGVPLTEQQVLAYVNQHPDVQLPVIEAQVSTFLNNNPEFAAALPVSEQQVVTFLDRNPEFEKKFRQASFKRMAESSAWFSA